MRAIEGRVARRIFRAPVEKARVISGAIAPRVIGVRAIQVIPLHRRVVEVLLTTQGDIAIFAQSTGARTLQCGQVGMATVCTVTAPDDEWQTANFSVCIVWPIIVATLIVGATAMLVELTVGH